jgi:hypothetical protein
MLEPNTNTTHINTQVVESIIQKGFPTSWEDAANIFRVLEVLKKTDSSNSVPLESSIDISKAYKKLSLLVHPDKYHDKERATLAFKILSQAFKILQNKDYLPAPSNTFQTSNTTQFSSTKSPDICDIDDLLSMHKIIDKTRSARVMILNWAEFTNEKIKREERRKVREIFKNFKLGNGSGAKKDEEDLSKLVDKLFPDEDMPNYDLGIKFPELEDSLLFLSGLRIRYPELGHHNYQQTFKNKY